MVDQGQLSILLVNNDFLGKCQTGDFDLVVTVFDDEEKEKHKFKVYIPSEACEMSCVLFLNVCVFLLNKVLKISWSVVSYLFLRQR